MTDKINRLVSVIIVNHNGRRWLKDCFESLLRQTYDNFEIIVVDNASTDDSVSFIRKNYPEIQIIVNKTNIGFGRANNLGVEKTRGEIIFFLNNDTLINKDTLEKLISSKAKYKLNIIGPKILDFDDRDVYSGRKLSIDITGYIGYGKNTFYVDGCALMIHKRDFLRLGGFDEKYFMYSEEIDLCWRAHLFGMSVGVCDSAAIKHFGGGTGGSTLYDKELKHKVPLLRRYEVEKNNLRNLLKNYKFINLLWVVPLFELVSLGESSLYLLTGNFAACGTVWKANLWNLKNIGDTLRERKIIQKKRVIGDLQILSKMFKGLNKFLAFRSIGLPKFKE